MTVSFLSSKSNYTYEIISNIQSEVERDPLLYWSLALEGELLSICRITLA